MLHKSNLIIIIAIFISSFSLLNLRKTKLTSSSVPTTTFVEFQSASLPNISYEAIQYSQENPADPHLALGLEDIVLVVNAKFEIYNKNNPGRRLYKTTFEDFFSSLLPGTGIQIFDPRVIFDHINNRFIMIVTARDDLTKEAWWLIAASQQSSAIGDWWIHITDATLDNTAPTTNYADFPDVGLDGTYLYLTADMIDFDTKQFQYNKVRVLYLVDIYAGAVTTYNDITDWRNQSDSPVQSLRVVQLYSPRGIMYFINMASNGALTLWSLQDPITNPVWHRSTITVGDFSDPPDAEQPDTATHIETNDPRLLEAKLGPTGIWTTHTIGYNSGTGTKAAIRLYEIKTDGSEVLNEITLVSTTEYLYYPSLAIDQAGNVILQFSLSSAERYASIAFTGRLATDPAHTIRPIVTLIKEGEGAYTNKMRWGDYSGTVCDPADRQTIWMFNQYATSSNTWSTWVATTSHFAYNLFLPVFLK